MNFGHRSSGLNQGVRSYGGRTLGSFLMRLAVSAAGRLEYGEKVVAIRLEF